MPKNFEPQSAFEGYVAGKLENIEKRIDDLPCKETFKRLNKCENDVSNMQGKATILGAVAGFITAFLAKHFFGK
ncbi:MAG: hypothetical protein WAX79_01700, partial [Candidatus Omnitrophota bacterium]